MQRLLKKSELVSGPVEVNRIALLCSRLSLALNLSVNFTNVCTNPERDPSNLYDPSDPILVELREWLAPKLGLSLRVLKIIFGVPGLLDAFLGLRFAPPRFMVVPHSPRGDAAASHPSARGRMSR